MINLRGVYFVRSEWLTMAQGSCMLWAVGLWMVWRPLVPRAPSCTLNCGGGDEVDPGQRDCLTIVSEDGASILFVAVGYRWTFLGGVKPRVASGHPCTLGCRGDGEADPGLGGCLVSLERSLRFLFIDIIFDSLCYRWAFLGGVMPRVCLGICVYLGLWRWRCYWPWVREDAAVSSPGARMAFWFLRLKIIGDTDGYCWPLPCFYNIFPLLCV